MFVTMRIKPRALNVQGKQPATEPRPPACGKQTVKSSLLFLALPRERFRLGLEPLVLRHAMAYG